MNNKHLRSQNLGICQEERGLEQFRMTAEAEQLDDLLCLVYPNEEIVAFDVALHAPGIVADEHVGMVVLRNGARVP